MATPSAPSGNTTMGKRYWFRHTNVLLTYSSTQKQITAIMQTTHEEAVIKTEDGHTTARVVAIVKAAHTPVTERAE